MPDIDHATDRAPHDAFTATRNGRLRFAIPVCLTVVAWLLAWPVPRAAAQAQADPCVSLTDKLAAMPRRP
jgi:hypothetical protein